MASQQKITIAIEGCCHGELDNIYATLQHLEKVEGKKIDLLICCGDFQAVRNMDDLETMACPPKYRAINTFYKYYSGEKQAPFPTLFIGGNHEAANYLWELYYGGWAAPNIYFMGFTGCVKFGGLRIGALSGIFKQGDYMRGHHERLPYTDSSMRSIYHVRDFEVYRLMQIKQPLDVFVSHDWPRNVADYGNKQALVSKKTFLRAEVEAGELGSPANEQLLHALRPSYWFSAHLHTKFAAVVPHPPPPPPVAAGGAAAAPATGGTATRFLALDKCLAGRDFLQVVELDAKGPLCFEYDEEWLAIMRTTHDLVNLQMRHRPLPGMGALRRGPDPADVAFVRQALEKRGSAAIPTNFAPTAPAFDPQAPKARGRMPTWHTRNPQTEALLDLLQLPYNLDHGQAAAAGAGGGYQQQPPAAAAVAAAPNPEEIDLGDLDDIDGEVGAPGAGASQGAGATGDGGEREGEGDGAGAAGDDDFIDDGDDVDADPMFQPINL